MEGVTATNIYWFTSVGLAVGFLIGLIMEKEGISLNGNILFGVVGANLIGLIGIAFGFGDGLWLSFIGLWPFLFLINVFHQHHIDDLSGKIEDPTNVVRRFSWKRFK